MLSYIFGYKEDVKEVIKDDDLMYRSHAKNFELNKQIRRVATKIKLNKTIPNVYIEDDTYLDHYKPVHSKRIIKHHQRQDSLESIYEVVQRLANHDKLIDETDEQLYCLNQQPTPPMPTPPMPTPPIPIPKKNRRR
jgi:hypothetical protein